MSWIRQFRGQTTVIKLGGSVMKDQEALGPALESFGIDKNSAIPVHLFVDASDNIRCVRVGSVHEGDFGAIKTILAGG